MEKIMNVLGNASNKVPIFINKKWIEVFNQSGETYNTNRQIKSKTSMLISDLCGFSDSYIVVKGNITVTNPNDDGYDKKLTFKTNEPFTNWILKINNTFTDNAKDLDIVMPMYNLIEYSKSYIKTTGSLWSYYRDEPNSGAVGNINYSIKDSRSFDYKTSIAGKLEGNNVEKDGFEIVMALKYLSNFWRTLDIPLINCDVFLTRTWSENCVSK